MNSTHPQVLTITLRQGRASSALRQCHSLDRRVSYLVVVNGSGQYPRPQQSVVRAHLGSTSDSRRYKLSAVEEILGREDCPSCGGEACVDVRRVMMRIEETGKMLPGEIN